MGIEPTAQAWEAWVLPLYDARFGDDFRHVAAAQANLPGIGLAGSTIQPHRVIFEPGYNLQIHWDP
jgi:hypothetical protein